ncbi:uncharacterized protein LOC126893457 isoform X1 [Diabrotica virgifera virgifera]|uniref:Uncharacterized protein n=1 Tax=Diabrotica virgifera virgifera TaxID=50390 RepID=A0ABM5LB08_DIAVI|nr:uncharacterized protein LOC126893457 isoform X1 [Diabrotica virgifera virgifera]
MNMNKIKHKYKFRSRTVKLVNEALSTECHSKPLDQSRSSNGSEYTPTCFSDDLDDSYEMHSISIETTDDSVANKQQTDCDLMYENDAILDDSTPNPIYQELIASSSLDNIEKSADETNSSLIDSVCLKKRRIRRKHNCIYCDIPVLNFARHLERIHSDELEVQKYLSLDKKDPKRKYFIDKIRKEGDFCIGKSVPVFRRNVLSNSDESSTNSNMLPCIHCKGYYAKKSLRRHIRRCYFNEKKATGKVRHQSEAQNLMATNFGSTDPLRTSGVLNSLAADDISLVAKKDKLICDVGRKYVKSHKDRHLIQVAKRQMRRLARLLIQSRKIENNSNLTLFFLLHPSKFKTIVSATRSIANYNTESKCFQSPSLALQMGTLIKKAISSAYSMEVQRDVDSANIKSLDVMKKLIDDQWALEISTEAGQNIQINRFNKPTLIPMAEDIAKMKTYLDELITSSITHLDENVNNTQAYKCLLEGTYCSLLLFNKRRVGELQRLPLDIYLKHHDSQSSKEFEKVLTETEKILVHSLKRTVIRGKRGRGVPVLFDKLTKSGVDTLIKYRNNFFTSYNEYLFGIPNTINCISGYHVLRKHASKVLNDANKITTLTSTRLRKHLATIIQILKMEKGELEQLAKFMGHTSKTHDEWYRLPSDIYQTAKVSKILLLAQNTNIDQYKNRNLNEIEVDNEILEDAKEADSDEENTNQPILQQNEVNIPSQNRIKEKGKRILVPWTKEEKELTQKFFARHIKKKIPPKKMEVLNLVEKYPNVFKNRKWDTIKVFVQNKYKSQ